MPNWFEDTFFLLHYDHHYSERDTPPALTGLDREQVARVLAQVRPDAVQYYAKGHPGLVPYRTRYGNQHPSVDEAGWADPLALYREITHELGIRFVVAYSGLIDQKAAFERPEWLRLKADLNPYPARQLCPNSSYVDELLLPQVDEIFQDYRPDGFWFDAENWTVSPCWCNVCLSEYQMMHGRSAPTDRKDLFWPEWLQFHRDSFTRYVGRVSRFMHDREPELVLSSNAAWTTHQPERLSESSDARPDRLTWDISPAFSLRQAGMEARFLESHGLPFDLMTWNRCSARPWGQGRLPALPAYPKSFEHLAQEGAAILANGGRWSVWVNAYPDDALPEGEHEVVTRAAQFARARQPWCHNTLSAAYVAVLHSDATHRHVGNGLYDPGPSLDRVRGAHQMLLELHHPHDIVNEDVLLREMDRYRVILLPEQNNLPPRFDDALTDWLRRGGRLIASGQVSPQIIEDIPTFDFEEVLGVRWTGNQEPESFLLHRGTALRLAAPTYHVALYGAEILKPLLRTGREVPMQDTGFPGVTRHVFGEGEGYYVAAELFSAYHRHQYPGLREVLADILEAALPVPPLMTTAPPSIETVLRTRGDELMLHFVNHDPGKSLAQNSPFIEAVPPSPGFTVTLALVGEPETVSLQPGNQEVEWSYSEGTLTAFIPPVHLHSVLALTFPPEPEPAPVAEAAAPPEPLAQDMPEAPAEPVPAEEAEAPRLTEPADPESSPSGQDSAQRGEA